MSKGTIGTKLVVATGIGAALYSVLSMVSLPIGPNTSLRIAVAILTIFGVMFGPVVGFLVGFIGHTLNDMLMWGSVWFSWVFLSAIIGLFAGLIKYDSTFDLDRGIVNRVHITKMYLYAVVGMIVAGGVAYVGDVFFYGEPSEKVLVQIALATLSNFIVTAVVGIPSVLLIAKRKRAHRDLKIEE